MRILGHHWSTLSHVRCDRFAQGACSVHPCRRCRYFCLWSFGRLCFTGNVSGISSAWDIYVKDRKCDYPPQVWNLNSTRCPPLDNQLFTDFTEQDGLRSSDFRFYFLKFYFLVKCDRSTCQASCVSPFHAREWCSAARRLLMVSRLNWHLKLHGRSSLEHWRWQWMSCRRRWQSVKSVLLREKTELGSTKFATKWSWLCSRLPHIAYKIHKANSRLNFLRHCKYSEFLTTQTTF